MESCLSIDMPSLPIESVYVISPFLLVTFTKGIETILVESYTLPVSHTCEDAVCTERRIRMI